MIWLIGYGLERTFAYTVERLEKLKVEYRVLDLDEIEHATQAHHCLDDDGLAVTVNGETRRLTFEDVVYVRAYVRDLRSPPRTAYLADLIEALGAYTAAVCAINPTTASIENGLKLLHLARLADCKFETPVTLAGTDDERIRHAVDPDETWITKGCSGVRTRVTILSKEDYGQLRSLQHCPSQFQKRVPGDDVRVHVIGRRCIALRMRTSATDYRYSRADEWQLLEKMSVPLSVEIKCLEYMRRANLLFGGFDFRVLDDRWVVLECNAMPGYDYYDRKLDGAISVAIAEFLQDRARHAASRDETVFVDDAPRVSFITTDRRPPTNHS
jgi:hypothetical protein